MIIPTKTIHSCSSELSNIDYANNLQLNRAKSAEIIFVKPRTRRSMSKPPSVISGFTRVESTFARKFSVSQHVDNRLATCSQSLSALRAYAITPNFASENRKMGMSAFSMGICLAKCLAHNISTTMRDRAMVSKDHL